MSFNEAIALQPQWVQLWLNVMFVTIFVLPLSWLIWRESRRAAIVALVTGIATAVSIMWLYEQIGYVRLLGAPHIVFWVPLGIFLWHQRQRADMPVWPARLMLVTLAVMSVSLVFDIVDAARWLLGARASMLPQ